MTHFTPEEFRCKCGRLQCDAPQAMQKSFLDRLEIVRGEYGQPMQVTSGLRCSYWNALKGGTPASSHLTGYAADIACPDSNARYSMLAAGLRVFTRLGIGKDFIHFGSDPTMPPRVIWLY